MRAHPRATDKRNACTHTRARPVFHVFTLGRVAAGVTCARLHTGEHRTGTVAPVGHTNVHACVTSLYALCLVHVHVRVRKYAVCTRLPHARANVYIRTCARRARRFARVGVPVVSFRFDKVHATRIPMEFLRIFLEVVFFITKIPDGDRNG